MRVSRSWAQDQLPEPEEVQAAQFCFQITTRNSSTTYTTLDQPPTFILPTIGAHPGGTHPCSVTIMSM